ncbi:MAG TPA: UDP-2,3-diacylglucosamine diphosphatase [Steroidobacteraceae bacterium]|nr:UDP-2,3-diacylglucosamine diphosphatase [Steroidobacteraceae bacterium]
MGAATGSKSIHLRTAFISDVHLGTRGCRADLLLEFLKSIHVETLVLVGDIIDMWSLRRNVFWPQEHINVIRTILGQAKRGTRVIYVPGNHDEVFRELAGSVFGNLEVQREYVHETVAGRRLLVVHGDEFDGMVKCSPWLAALGVWIYDVLLWLNHHLDVLRRALGFPYWSLASYLKHKSRNAVEHIRRFEHAAASLARRRGLDGIVCGHIHRARVTRLESVLYCNDGDWVESCTTLVEDLNGALSLWRWSEQRARLDSAAAMARDEPIERAA